MKKIVLTLFSISVSLLGFTQNLVMNGEFTNLGMCVGCTDAGINSVVVPVTFSTSSNPEITKATGWKFGYAQALNGSTGTPDLYSAAGLSTTVTIPECNLGTVPAGPPCHYFSPIGPITPTDEMKNYARFAMIGSSQVNEMAGESLLGTLNSSLVPGSKYVFKCRVNTFSSGTNFIIQFRNSGSTSYSYGTMVEQNVPINPSRDSWTTICFEFELPLDYSGSVLDQIEIGGNINNVFNVGSFFLDQISLKEKIKIDLPQTINVCTNNFQQICGPTFSTDDIYTYEWWGVNQSNALVLLSSFQCYTPSQYGEYTLIMTDECGFTSDHTISVVEGFGPKIPIEDVNYCEEAPALVGLVGPYADALSYAWTFDDGSGPISVGGPNAYQVANQGDGQYCVAIQWSGANVSNLLGCESQSCFTVGNYCEPTIRYCEDECIFTFTPDLIVPSGSTVTYLWDFGNGQTSTDMNPSLQFQNYGVNLVTVTITIDDGFNTTEVVQTFSVFNNCADEICEVNAHFNVATVGIVQLGSPRTYEFSNNSTFSTPNFSVTYEWDINLFNTTTNIGTYNTGDVTVTLPGGKYYVCLTVTVTNLNGVQCVDTYCRVINVPQIPIGNPNPGGGFGNFMKISPNPSNGHFNAILEDKIDASISVDIKVRNMQGKVVYSDTQNGRKQYHINLMNEPSGIYLLELRFDNKKLSKQVVIQ